MLFINHLTGGLTFSVTFCSFADINIYEKPEYLALTLFSAVLPDIDSPKSIIGRVAYPLAKWIEKNHGHRTVTHSLLACIVYTVLVATIERIFQAEHLAIIAFVSYLSHLIFDMSTRSGVPFFYPIQKYRCVLPANPKMRLRTGDLRAEGIIFFCFIFLNFLSLDLAANGFWSTYNKAFATFPHIQREQVRNPQPIYLNLKHKYTGQPLNGYLVESKANKSILLAETGFTPIENPEYEIIDFKHQGTKKTERISFEEITADSLNKLLAVNILEANILSTTSVRYRDKNQLPVEGKVIHFINRKSPKVYPIQQDTTNTETEKKLLQEQINLEFKKERDSQKELKALTKALADVQESYQSLSAFEQGKAIKQIAELEHQIKKFTLYKADITLYSIKLEKLQQTKIQPTLLSGVFTKLSIFNL